MGAFFDALNSCGPLKGKGMRGLRALCSNSKCVSVADSKKLEGSVDIDAATSGSCPNDCRWDYAVGYDSRVSFVEVHPANTSNVEEVIKKLGWLVDWLNSEAIEFDKLSKNGFYWVPSGKNAILKTSPQARRLSQSKITLISHLHLK